MISRDKHVRHDQRNATVVECPLGPRTKRAATLEINRPGGGGGAADEDSCDVWGRWGVSGCVDTPVSSYSFQYCLLSSGVDSNCLLLVCQHLGEEREMGLGVQIPPVLFAVNVTH